MFAGESVGRWTIREVATSRDGLTLGTVQAEDGTLARLEAAEAGLADPAEVAAHAEALQAAAAPYLARVLDCGEHDGGAWRVVEAPTLIAPPSGPDALDTLRQAAGAIDALHAAGIVLHGPAAGGLMVDAGSGSAFLPPPPMPAAGGQAAETVTAPEAVDMAGVPPEVLLGGTWTSAGDIFCLGVRAFEALTGERPFPTVESAIAHAHGGQAPRASLARPGLPAAVDEPLAAALAADPELRPASAGDLLVSLAQALGSGGAPPESRTPEPPRRRRRTAPLVLAAGGAAVAVAAIAALVLLLGGEDSADAVKLPPLGKDVQPLGSSLKGDGVLTLGCDGRPVRAASPECTVLQTRLDGAQLVAAKNGSLSGWTVRGARGDLMLQVLRPRDGGHFQVAVSQLERVPDAGVHHFEANVPVEQGDVIALQIPRGGGVGVREGSAGAGTHRWMPPKAGGAPTAADQQEGSGFDHEVMLRVDYRPGIPYQEPAQLNGQAAASAPAGRTLARRRLALSAGNEFDIRLVEVGGRIVLDAVDSRNRRAARIVLPLADPRGSAESFDVTAYDQGSGEAGILWRNPGRPLPVAHYFGFTERAWTFYS